MPKKKVQAQVVQKLDSAVQRLNNQGQNVYSGT